MPLARSIYKGPFDLGMQDFIPVPAVFWRKRHPKKCVICHFAFPDRQPQCRTATKRILGWWIESQFCGDILLRFQSARLYYTQRFQVKKEILIQRFFYLPNDVFKAWGLFDRANRQFLAARTAMKINSLQKEVRTNQRTNETPHTKWDFQLYRSFRNLWSPA